jgi:2-dehydropantoate 2-reductase
MRYIVYGAGAVGGTIGGRLAQHGHDVVLIARGAHHDAIRDRGLTLEDPDDTVVLRVAVAPEPAALTFGDGDVVILAMKAQDADAAVRSLAAVAPPEVAVVSAQNGVEGERVALRRFPHVYGICVMLPAAHLEPGVVQVSSAPVSGILDIGRYPMGVDETAEKIAADLDASTFSSHASASIMRFKYAKLLMNLANAIDAACGPGARGSDLHTRARTEAVACLAAAGIDVASEDEDRARRGELLRMRPIRGERRGGGSSWQSLARGTGSIEADYLNGEIVLLGRLHGIPTPVNAMLQRVANRLAREHVPPGSWTIEQLEAQLDT